MVLRLNVALIIAIMQMSQRFPTIAVLLLLVMYLQTCVWVLIDWKQANDESKGSNLVALEQMGYCHSKRVRSWITDLGAIGSARRESTLWLGAADNTNRLARHVRYSKHSRISVEEESLEAQNRT